MWSYSSIFFRSIPSPPYFAQFRIGTDLRFRRPSVPDAASCIHRFPSFFAVDFFAPAVVCFQIDPAFRTPFFCGLTALQTRIYDLSVFLICLVPDALAMPLPTALDPCPECLVRDSLPRTIFSFRQPARAKVRYPLLLLFCCHSYPLLSRILYHFRTLDSIRAGVLRLQKQSGGLFFRREGRGGYCCAAAVAEVGGFTQQRRIPCSAPIIIASILRDRLFWFIEAATY